MKQKKCYICKKDLVYFTMVLMTGAAGYRRYPLCDKCKKDVMAKEEKRLKKQTERGIIS